MCGHTHQQKVESNGGELLAWICLGCLHVFCKDCHQRVFWPDNDNQVRVLEEEDGPLFCRCRPCTKRFAHRKPTKRDAV